MHYSILFEAVKDPGFPEGFFYAHIPALDLTTHGEGIEGAKSAAVDLITAWIEEKRAHGEPVPVEAESYFSSVEVDDAVLGA
jgi:predicted RNase H-like HicB family nuclease